MFTFDACATAAAQSLGPSPTAEQISRAARYVMAAVSGVTYALAKSAIEAAL